MILATSNAIMIINGKEYSGNDLFIGGYRGDKFHIVHNTGLKFDKGFTYEANLSNENGFYEYDCKAVNENGHVKDFILKFPSKGITVVRNAKRSPHI